MKPIEINLLTQGRGLVVAPAGCGKTQLIADTLERYEGDKPILILTHTNAGVVALRNRMNRAGVKSANYHISTIDGWAIKLITTFPARSGHDPKIVTGVKPVYYEIRSAARKLLKDGHLDDILKASYAHLIVDECQDCSKLQLGITYHAGRALSTTLLGDNMQAIFDFDKKDPLADWSEWTCKHFPLIGKLSKPWRWIRVEAEPLGLWLLEARESLQQGHGVNLANRPDTVEWVQLDGSELDHDRLLKACRINAENNGGVLIIGESTNPKSQRQFASKTFGAVTVESVDLRDLVTFAQTLDLHAENALQSIIYFAKELMTNVGATELLLRVKTLQNGKEKKIASIVEKAALSFISDRSHGKMRDLLIEIQKQAGVKVFRPDILRCCIQALNSCDATTSFHDAAVRMREQNRMMGRPLPKKAVGSTLLLKGLEAEVVVILNADSLNSKNLYVAMTRGARKVVICSQAQILGKEK